MLSKFLLSSILIFSFQRYGNVATVALTPGENERNETIGFCCKY